MRKITIEKSYQSFYNKSKINNIEEDLKDVLRQLIIELRQLKSQLMLKDDELLTTLILAALDFDKNEGKIIVVGDGLICVNGKMIEFDQDNIPDYLGYHLGEDFESWFRNQKQIITIEGIEDISIATDGIFTFSKYDENNYSAKQDTLEYLLLSKEDEMLGNMLNKKFLYLEQQCGLRPTDDLGVVRIIK